MNPWFNSNLSRLIEARSQYFRLFKLGIVSRQENNQFRNRVNQIIQKTKNQYYTKLFDLYKNSVSKTWNLINSLTGRKYSNRQIKQIILDGKEISDSDEMCNAFNNYFGNIARKLDENLPSLERSYQNFFSPNNQCFF